MSVLASWLAAAGLLVSEPSAITVPDGLLAATGRIHGLTLATRNVRDVARSGVDVINPFDRPPR